MALNRRIITETIVLAGAVAVFLNYQALANKIALYTFTPQSNIAPLITSLRLTPYAQGVLYRAKPQIDSKAAFNADCNPDVGDLELGCYAHGRIYILQIDNASLAPEMTVVLGHELLHDVWAQTGSSKQKALGSELETVYHGMNDDNLTSRMGDYAKSEPGEETNELHSILGSETSILTPELERHYATIFRDRTVLTSAQSTYTSVFTGRRNELTAQSNEIIGLKQQLASLEQRMSAYKSSGNIGAYNSLVSSQNDLANSINAKVQAYNAGVDEYNALSKVLDSQQITPAS